MKIVVTGALGHIGSKLIRELAHYFRDSELILVDDLSTNRYCSLFNLSDECRYRFIESRAQDLSWDELLERVDVVVHLAALTDAAGTAHQPEKIHQNNFESTVAVGLACKKNNVPLIFPSSTSVYGVQDGVVDEDCTESDLKPQSPYAESKLKEEKYLKELYRNSGLKMCILRLGTIFGISSGMRFHTAVNKFCWQAAMGNDLTVWKTAYEQKRPYLDLSDASRLICFVIAHSLYNGEIYNAVTRNCTVKEVINTINEFVPNLRINFVDSRIMNQLSYEVLNKKIENEGFAFEGDLRSGISDTISMLKNMNYQAYAEVS